MTAFQFDDLRVHWAVFKRPIQVMQRPPFVVCDVAVDRRGCLVWARVFALCSCKGCSNSMNLYRDVQRPVIDQ